MRIYSGGKCVLAVFHFLLFSLVYNLVNHMRILTLNTHIIASISATVLPLIQA